MMTDEQMEAIRRETGEAKLAVRKPNWTQLVSQSVHVRVRATRWSAKGNLTLDDLGLGAMPKRYRDAARRRYELGHYTLMPEEMEKQFHSLVNRARQSCGRYGIKSPWGGTLIPLRHYRTWRETMEEAQAAFFALVQVLTDSRDDWAARILTDYREMLVLDAARDAGLPIPEQPDWELLQADLDPERLARVERRIAELQAEIPDSEFIREKYGMDWFPEVLEVPDTLKAGLALDELERRIALRQQDLWALEERLEARRKQALDDAEYRTHLAEAEAEAVRLRALVMDEEETLAIRREIYREQQTKAAELQRIELDGLCVDVAAQVRSTMMLAAQSILGTIQGKGKVYSQQLAALRDLVTDLRAFNLQEDSELDEIARQVEAATAGVKPADVDLGELKSLLADIHVYAKAGLMSLERLPRLSDEDRTAMSDEAIREYYRPPSEGELEQPLSRFATRETSDDDLSLDGLLAGEGRLRLGTLEPELAGSSA
jgi:hypothetical protein